jgi:CHAD domain-containing protein
MRAEVRRVAKDPGKEEAVHRARVASRRFLAAGELWASQADGWRSLSEKISRLIRKLGRVRNLDVSLSLLRKGPAGDRKARKELVSIFKRRRKKELVRLGSWLTLRRVERLEDRYRKLKSTVGSAPASAPPGPPSLRPYFERLARLAELIGSESDIEAGHEARRELRRLRYAHEMLTTEYESSQFSADTERFRSVQQVAGAWHDLCILEELAVKVERKGKTSASLRPLLDRVRGEAKTKLDEFVSALAELEGLRPRLTAEEAE